MRVPGIIFELTSSFDKNDIDYRIAGGQAAVFYNLRDEAEDWDLAIQEVTPKLKKIMESFDFIEIPDSDGLSWEGPTLVDFIIADGKKYPTLEELGVRYVNGLKFVKRSMMGYINWKKGESAYQHLKDYRTRIEQEKLPFKVQEIFDPERFEMYASIDLPVRKSEGQIMSYLRLARENPIPGGLGDNLLEENVILEELERGIEVESEHVENNPELAEDQEDEVAADIAYDHLEEIPNYYTWLDWMEEVAKDNEEKEMEIVDARVASRLIRLASKLEDSKCPLQACLLDRLVREAGIVKAYDETTIPKPVIMDSSFIQRRIAMEVLTRVTGMSPVTLDYYRSIKSMIKQYHRKLEQLSQMDKGSQAYIQDLRYITHVYNKDFDPYNTDHVPTKIYFLWEVFKLEDIIHQNVGKMITPELGEEAIVERFIERLKEQGLLQELNKLKRALG